MIAWRLYTQACWEIKNLEKLLGLRFSVLRRELDACAAVLLAPHRRRGGRGNVPSIAERVQYCNLSVSLGPHRRRGGPSCPPATNALHGWLHD